MFLQENQANKNKSGHNLVDKGFFIYIKSVILLNTNNTASKEVGYLCYNEVKFSQDS